MAHTLERCLVAARAREAFDAWRAWAGRRALNRERVEVQRRRCARTVMRAVFSGWRSYAVERATRRRKLAQAQKVCAA